MLRRAVEHEHAMRPMPGERRNAPRLSRNGFAIAETTTTMTNVRTASRIQCSIRMRLRVLPHGGHQEPHRRPGNLAEFATVQQVNDDRHRRRGHAPQQQGVGEAQGQYDRRGQACLLSSAGGLQSQESEETGKRKERKQEKAEARHSGGLVPQRFLRSFLADFRTLEFCNSLASPQRERVRFARAAR